VLEVAAYGRMEVKEAVGVSPRSPYAAHDMSWIAVNALVSLLHGADAVRYVLSLIYHQDVSP